MTATLKDFIARAPLGQRLEALSSVDLQVPALRLAKRLADAAALIDAHTRREMLQTPYTGSTVIRDFDNPPDYTHQTVLDEPVWADPSDYIGSAAQENWNEGRRKSLVGTYDISAQDGLPAAPFGRNGIGGRGLLGRYGPANKAVDVLMTSEASSEDGQKGFYVFCILKGQDRRAAMCGGHVEWSDHEPEGGYNVSEDLIAEMRAKELLEEMLSGAIKLLPDYQAQADGDFTHAVAVKESSRGQPVGAEEKETLKRQIEAGIKVKQVQAEDPLFYDALVAKMRSLKNFYEGPVPSSGINTNHAWIETYVAALDLDELVDDVLNLPQNKGQYSFSAGDDAKGVAQFRLTPSFIEASWPSHRALFVLAAANYLLNQNEKNIQPAPEILAQLEEVADYAQKLPIKLSP